MMRWLLTLLGLTLTTATANPLLNDKKLELLVPAYFYPGTGDDLWPALSLAAKRVPLTVIMNPANGPGSVTDPAYAQAVRMVRAAGAKVIGYVHISYGKRPIEQVRADIARYRTLYEVDGVFIDEMASDTPIEKVNYQAGLIAQIRSESPTWVVVANPGVMPHPIHLGEHRADMIVSFENTAAQWVAANESDHSARADTPREPIAGLAHLVHTTTSARTMRQIVSGANDSGVQAIFVTDDLMDNPWDTLPTWWPGLVDQVAAINSGV